MFSIILNNVEKVNIGLLQQIISTGLDTSSIVYNIQLIQHRRLMISHLAYHRKEIKLIYTQSNKEYDEKGIN